MKKLVVQPSCGLRGTLRVPGDKSISHRAAIFASLAQGKSLVKGFLFSEDCRATWKIFRKMGVRGKKVGKGLLIHGAGLYGLKAPRGTLDAGNSGTTARLLLGLLAAQPFQSSLTGDASLRRRPMRRVVEPLIRMGARITGRKNGDLLPLTVEGAELKGGVFQLSVASAQVKSALLLAGLYARGKTRVIEPAESRDHTERMMEAFGIPFQKGKRWVEIEGPARPFSGRTLTVPGDFSSAAFFIVAALLVPNSRLVLKDIGLNPTRTGLLEVLRKMGADIEVKKRKIKGEPVGDVAAKTSRLRAVTVAPRLAPSLIDEYPILAVAATQANGRTVIRGAKELRVKESDRIHAMAATLARMGAKIRELPDGWVIQGPTPLFGARVACFGDHRVAMSLAVAGLCARGKTVLLGTENIRTSFPGFEKILRGIQR